MDAVAQHRAHDFADHFPVFYELNLATPSISATNESNSPPCLTKICITFAAATLSDTGTLQSSYQAACPFSHSGRIGPDTPSNAPSISSHTRSLAGSTGPGMVTWPRATRLKPLLP